MKKVVAFGPVIVVEGRLLVTKDGKDNFYKIPGGKPLIGESGEECCLRELREETGLDAKIVRPLSSLILDRNPQTNEKMDIFLHHYFCKLKNSPLDFEDYFFSGHFVSWLLIEEILDGKYSVAPNIKFLLAQGEIK